MTHAIDEMSPLHGLSLEDMDEENGEIIAVLDGIDEISSQSYQSRWSYKSKEILPHREFLPCVKRDVGCFVVDFNRISYTTEVEELTVVDTQEEMDELTAAEDFQSIRAPKRYGSGPIVKRVKKTSIRRLKTDGDIAKDFDAASNPIGRKEVDKE